MRPLLLTLLVFATTAIGAVNAKAQQCPAAGPPVRDIAIADEAQLPTDGPLVTNLDGLAVQADLVQRSRSSPKPMAACALSHLVAWATGEAYLGEAASDAAKSQRNRDLAGLAIAYLKLKSFATAEDRAIIEPWLIKVADAASETSNSGDPWRGLALAATATATESKPHWEIAKSILEHVTGPDGAASSPGASLTALAPLAEFAAAHDFDAYALNDGALHKLSATALAELKSAPDRSAGWGWIALYKRRFPERMADAPYQSARHRWLGGDVTVLVGVLERGR